MAIFYKEFYRPILVSCLLVALAGTARAQDFESSAEGPEEARSTIIAEDVAEGAGLVSFRIAGSALKPRQDDVSYSVGGGGACAYVTAGDALTVWNHAVTLPQGSVINTLRMYYYDTSASNSTAWFTVYDLYGSIVEEWPVSTSTTGGNSFNDSALIDHQIDYNVYSYLLNWRPGVTGSTMQLCGFRIFYQ